jgi:chromosome transmission fidelity protein 1
VALDKYCDETRAKSKANYSNYELAMPPGDLVSALGEKIQGVNLLEIEAYLRSSKIAIKISGYSDKVEEREALGERAGIHCDS